MYPAVTFSGRSNNFGARLFFGGSGTLLYAPPTGYLPIHDYVVQKHHQKKETKRIRLLQLSLQTLNETFLYEYASVVVPNCLEELKRLASLSHPKPSIDVRYQKAEAVYLANLLAQNINRLSATECQQFIDEIERLIAS